MEPNRPVQENEYDPGIGCRVFKRSTVTLTIFWNTFSLTEDQKKEVHLAVKQQDHWIPLIFNWMDATEIDKDKKDTAVAMIKQEENKLNPIYNYLIRISLGNGPTMKQAYLKVYPYDEILPEDKDEKSHRNHNMGWNPQRRRWTRIELVLAEDGTWCIPVKIMK